MVELCVATFIPVAEMTIFKNIYSFLHSTAGKSCAKDHISSARGLKAATDFCVLEWPVQTRLMEAPETVVC